MTNIHILLYDQVVLAFPSVHLLESMKSGMLCWWLLSMTCEACLRATVKYNHRVSIWPAMIVSLGAFM